MGQASLTVPRTKLRAFCRKRVKTRTCQNTSPSSTTPIMSKRAPLTPISGNKTPRKELNILTKGEILGQAKLGATLTEISRNLNVPRSTVYGVLDRLHTTPSGVSKSRSGRPPVITPRAARTLVRTVRAEPKITWRKLKQDTGIDLDSRTLKHTLEANGISHWLALKRPKLTAEIALLRLNWAKNHEHWTVEEWRKVIWSDEASVARGSGKGKEWAFGTLEQKWDRDKLQELTKGKAFRIMIWGAFWGSGKSELYLLREIGSPKNTVILRPPTSRFWMKIWLEYGNPG